MLETCEVIVLDDTSELAPLIVRRLSTAVSVKQGTSGSMHVTRQMLRELLTAMDVLGARDPDASVEP